MPILRELAIALVALTSLLLVSNALVGPTELATTSASAAPAQQPPTSSRELTPQQRIDAVFGQFVAVRKSRAI
jgi:hypothetical protein